MGKLETDTSWDYILNYSLLEFIQIYHFIGYLKLCSPQTIGFQNIKKSIRILRISINGRAVAKSRARNVHLKEIFLWV
jgi:hypothetical protein